MQKNVPSMEPNEEIMLLRKKEENQTTAERLASAERARLAGTVGYSVDEFEKNMKEAIAKGVAHSE